jgi:hypothetical protein
MVSVDEDAIECVEIINGARNDVRLKNKDSLLRIGMLRDQPILKCGKKYTVLDGAATAYIYEEK